MSKKSVTVWISHEANKKLVVELEDINQGCTNRRGDFVMTKSQRISQIIDEHYGTAEPSKEK